MLFLTFLWSCDKEPPGPSGGVPGPTGPLAEIIHTSLNSQYISEKYLIDIFLPAAFESNKNLPVLYVLDGGWLFDPMLIVRADLMLDVIIVGIDHEVTGDQPKRGRDYSPNGWGGKGGEDFLNFSNFLTQQVIPYIDGKYDNDHSSRSILGYSSSGAYSSIALLMEDPENVIFHGYISVDPVIGCGSAGLEASLQDFNFLDVADSIRFHFSQSSETNNEWLNEFLEAKDYPFLDFEYSVFGEHDHVTVFPVSARQGLMFVYDL